MVNPSYDPTRARAVEQGIPTQRTATEPQQVRPQHVGMPYGPHYYEARRQCVASTTPDIRAAHKQSLGAHRAFLARTLGLDHADALLRAGHFMAFHEPSFRAMHDVAQNLPGDDDRPPWGRKCTRPSWSLHCVVATGTRRPTG